MNVATTINPGQIAAPSRAVLSDTERQFSTLKRDTFGHVTADEEPEAIALRDKLFVELTGKPYEARVCGYFLTLKIWIRPDQLAKGVREDGTEYTIWRATETEKNDKFQSCSALVIDVGPSAYKGRNADGSPKFPEGPWCRIGDWVTVPRYEAHLFTYRGVALGILPDDRIMQVLTDPNDVMPITQ
jgi:hypothetical protein